MKEPNWKYTVWWELEIIIDTTAGLCTVLIVWIQMEARLGEKARKLLPSRSSRWGIYQGRVVEIYNIYHYIAVTEWKGL